MGFEAANLVFVNPVFWVTDEGTKHYNYTYLMTNISTCFLSFAFGKTIETNLKKDLL